MEDSHALIHAKTSNGDSKLFSCGSNFYGQLGLGSTGNRCIFQSIDMSFLPINFCIERIISGRNSYFILTRSSNGDTKLFAWGSNEYNQQGFYGTRHVNKPTCVDLRALPADVDIAELTPGGSYMSVKTKHGENCLFAWGDYGLKLYRSNYDDGLAYMLTPVKIHLQQWEPIYEKRLSVYNKALLTKYIENDISRKTQHVNIKKSGYYQLGLDSATSSSSYLLSYFRVCGNKSLNEWRKGYAHGLLNSDSSNKKLKNMQ